MIEPKKSLKRMYYFTNDNVIYNIDSVQDADKCGKNPIVYEDDEKTKIDYAASAEIFPSFKVTFRASGETPQQVDVYYFLQDLIADGDKFDGTAFTHTEHSEDTGKTYIDMFTESIDSDIAVKASNGYTVEKILESLPFYCKGADPAAVESSFIDNSGKTHVGVFSATTGFEKYDEAKVTAIAYDALDKKAKAYTNNLIKPFKKQLKSDFVIVKDDNMEDIPEPDDNNG